MKKFYLPAIFFVAILLVFLTIYAQNSRASSNTSRWDYKAISVYRSSSPHADGSWTQWFETFGDVQQQLPQPVSPAKRLRELGAQGWELVSVTPLSAANGGSGTSGYSDVAGFTTHITYWLKRLQE